MKSNSLQIKPRFEIYRRDNISELDNHTHCSVGTIPCKLERACSVTGAGTDEALFFTADLSSAASVPEYGREMGFCGSTTLLCA